MKELLTKLLSTYGPSGREGQIQAVIEELVRPYVDELRVDALGNLIAIKRGNGKRIMFAAHMDQIGFVVTDADEHGFLRVFQVGGIRRTNSVNRHVVSGSGLHGVLSSDIQDVNPADVSLSTLFIDIGARNREEALQKVQSGDMFVYTPEIYGDERRMAAPAMDNRAGCALLVAMLRALQDSPNEVVCVFTTQEELGLRGATAAAYDISPDIGIALDVTPCGDTPKGMRNNAIELGKGIAVKILDQSLICTPWVVEKLEAAAKRADIPYQREVLVAGGTDAAAIQRTKGGIPAGVLSVPCRYVHSAVETIDLGDMEGGVKLLVEFLSQAV